MAPELCTQIPALKALHIGVPPPLNAIMLRVGVCAAHGVVVPVNLNATREIAKSVCTCDIGTDDVALDEIAGTARSEDHTKVAIVARDQIAGRRAGISCQTADQVTREATIEIQTNVWIRQSDCSGYVRANKVALHRG